MKKIFFIFLIILVILAPIGVGIVSAFTEIRQLPLPRAYIYNIEGDVRIKTAAADWTSAVINQEIKAGDGIKTGANGELSINFFNNSVSRIGPDSETKISQAQIDKFNYAKTQVGLTVILGRVWSRIVNLADREATFEVGSNSTVATVRGTTIDFERTKSGEDRINAVESIVNVSLLDSSVPAQNNKPKVLKTINLTQGSQALFVPGKATEDLVVAPTPAATAKSAWFSANNQQDKKFEDEMKALKEKQNRELAGTLSDSSLYGIKRLAEGVKLALTPDEGEKRALEAAFANRRLAEAQALIEEGKTGLAESANQEYQAGVEGILQDLKNTTGNQAAEIQGQIENQINLQKDLMADITPDQPAYGIKQSLLDFTIKNAASEAEKNYLLYKETQQSLQEAGILKQSGNDALYQEQMKLYSDSLKALEQLKDPELLNRIKLLEGIIKQISIPDLANPQTIKSLIPENLTEQIQKAQETIDQIQKNIEANLPPKPAPTVPEQTTPPIEKPSIVPNINPQIKPTEPVIPPPTITTPSELVKPAKKLTEITITAEKYTMLAKESKQFRATAKYSDGTSKDVTDAARWSLSGDIGTISDSGLVQSDEDGGVGRVSASYSEDGVTVSGSAPHDITALTLMM